MLVYSRNRITYIDLENHMAFKDKTELFKETKSKAYEEIEAIEKLEDPAERLAQYKALSQKLSGLYSGGKPVMVDGEGAAIGGAMGGILGLVGAGVAGSILVPAATVPVALAIIGGGIVSGATGGAGFAGILSGKQERKEMRSNYGSIRNARRMYRVEKLVDKKIEEERKTLQALERNTRLQQQFDEAFKKETPAPVEDTAVTEAPKSLPKKITKPSGPTGPQ